MKVAVPAATDLAMDSMVDFHFGDAPYFVIVNVEGDDVGDAQVVKNPYDAEHAPGQVPQFVHDQGADVVVTSAIGNRAVVILSTMGIDVYVGAQGKVEEAVHEFVQGDLEQASPEQGDSGEHHHHQH